jgi:hypothetical protein
MFTSIVTQLKKKKKDLTLANDISGLGLFSLVDMKNGWSIPVRLEWSGHLVSPSLVYPEMQV